MKSIYDIESGHDSHDTKIKSEYDITYKCGNCDNEITINDYNCPICDMYIDWLKVLKTEYVDEEEE